MYKDIDMNIDILCIYRYRYRYIYMLPFYGKGQPENGRPGDFPLSVYRLLIVQTEVVICPFVDETTNRNYPFANRLNELAHL